VSVEISLSEAISAALARTLAAGALSNISPEAISPANIPLERPKNRDHGDFATSIALALAKQAGKKPREIAESIATELPSDPMLAKIEIAGPGFINLTLNSASQGQIVETILREGGNFGKTKDLSGVRINVEFISANPTGPIHLGHTRWAAVGDALARVLIAAGADVTREGGR